MTDAYSSMTSGNGSTDASRIAKLVSNRGIAEVLHFTTSKGLVGILATGELKSRSLLSVDKYLESIYTPNAQYRREAPEYWRYVNMSITRVNDRFFSFSRNWKAHEDIFWLVLAFDPVIMTHDGVLFAPTNMAYDGVTPASGADGCHAIFADRVPSGFGRWRLRQANWPASRSTDPQAEVLYPDSVPTRYLTRVYAETDNHAAAAEGYVGAVDHDEVDVKVEPAVFRR